MLEPRKHIVKCLAELTRDPDSSFDSIYKFILNEEKHQHKELFVYLNKVIDHTMHTGESQPMYTHVHFESIDESFISGIFEFLTIRFFLKFYLIDQDISSQYLDQQINKIRNIIGRGFNPGQDVSAKSLAYKKAKGNWDNQKKRLKFYEALSKMKGDDSGEFIPKVLMNVLKRDLVKAKEIFRCRPFAIPINELSTMNLSYVLLNSDKDRDGVDEELGRIDGHDVFEEIEYVVIFNCEGRSIHKGFNISLLEELNRQGTDFKHLFVFSFGDNANGRLNRLISSLDRVENSYYIRPKGLRFSSYVILQDEIDRLTDDRTGSKVEVRFIETDHVLCQVLREHLNEHEELYELYSIKMRNIYSLCLGPDIKQMILDEIFSDDIESPILISEETKRCILDIEGSYVSELKTTLESILDIIVDKSQDYLIQEVLSNSPCGIILPSVVFEHDKLLDMIERYLNASGDNILTQWHSYKEMSETRLIILDYRDTGRFPYQIFPNILELRLDNDQHPVGHFYSMFFQYNYEFTTYEYYKTFVRNVLDHPFRKDHFDWDRLIAEIEDHKPVRELFEHLWDMENSYEYTERETIMIKYNSGSISYWPSQLFVVNDENDSHLYTDRAEDLLDEFEKNGNVLKVQPIDELYRDMNLFRTTEQEEAELRQLKTKYDLHEEELEHRLWKVLLKREADKSGVNQLYDELCERVKQVGAKIVSRHYFENAWLDPQSDSLIPRSKRVFKVLCDLLALPKVYYAVMLKKRANNRLASRKSTSKMNRLIADMIHAGLFDPDRNDIELESFMKSHDLEEIGLTEENYKDELTTLVDLLKPYLDLKTVKKIELK